MADMARVLDNNMLLIATILQIDSKIQSGPHEKPNVDFAGKTAEEFVLMEDLNAHDGAPVHKYGTLMFSTRDAVKEDYQLVGGKIIL
jgi:hypothetical protein